MQRKDQNGHQAADVETAKSDLSDRVRQETQSAKELFQDARDELGRKAEDYASEAKDALSGKAEKTQRDISASLAAFGGALRAASEHLANSDQQRASKYVLDAAGGLERLSSSLKEKSFEQVLGEVQSFGRENSGALVAGSVLAGLALGRFIKSSSPSGSGRKGDQSQGENSADSNARPKSSPDKPGDDASVGHDQ
ncbi:hypothetical protein LB542_28005 [Mesorhizobium sp. BR1-1-9]|uniref:hypothetical protein n=1 Tax=unclassified Mesorhizobium TaxID=325217 RepID=UPI0015E33903|nr:MULTISPECIES: hypothetical protein [unclassified Mesorhizobium]MBZ9811182.1 hypothetical protein [Mesorhizobium sp. ESP-6-2]MBZ9874681.1 hypothetical protein [Mesorhizobium sp. BR1-1-9]MBZ9942153.1 hypothetical protein [Mesorhizobium sp. BR1-1-13]